MPISLNQGFSIPHPLFRSHVAPDDTLVTPRCPRTDKSSVIAIFALGGWAVIGLIVAAVEKSLHRKDDLDETLITVLCVAGAVAGAVVGQTFGLFVFGQPAGFLCAAAGAKGLLELYRSRQPTATVKSESRPSSFTAPPPTPPPPSPPLSLGTRLGDAVGWGIACAVVVSVAGVVSHGAGSFVYPQRYEQIPSDLVFIPLALILGFIAGAAASVVRPQWRGRPMLVVIVVAALVWAAIMFEYARGRAVGAGLAVTFDPNPGVPVSCATVRCPQADPPLEWMLQGTMRVQETNNMGATVNAISIYSWDRSSYSPAPGRMTRAEAIERSRFDGPRVRFEGREINGTRQIRPHDVVAYPVTYYYRTRTGDPQRDVEIYIEFTDTAWRSSGRAVVWKVR